MNQGIGSDHRALADIEYISFEVTYLPAGFFDQ
jgi:hypothetical protein